MKIVIINDDYRTVSNRNQELINIGITPTDIVIIEDLPKEFDSWESYAISRIKPLKEEGETIIIYLDRTLVKIPSFGIENSIDILSNLLRNNLLEEGDKIVCDSDIAYQQVKEIKEFLSKGYSYYKYVEYNEYESFSFGEGIEVLNFFKKVDSYPFVIQEYNSEASRERDERNN